MLMTPPTKLASGDPPHPWAAPSSEWLAAIRPTLLTFDDGPSEDTTPRILDVLERFGIHSIFFIVGKRLEIPACRQLVERMVAGAHLIGNHSYTHVDLAKVSSQRVLDEIEHTQTILESIGIKERLFRPPYGRVSDTVIRVANQLNYWGLGWSVDTNDWKPEHQDGSWADQAISKIASQRENVVLMHDVHESTARELERFIEGLFALGCSFPSLFCRREEPEEKVSPWTHAPDGTRTIASIQLFRPSSS
jgi:peptidoglycan/xylan/chitin deacetylase (PgdA/CDA1 family)